MRDGDWGVEDVHDYNREYLRKQKASWNRVEQSDSAILVGRVNESESTEGNRESTVRSIVGGMAMVMIVGLVAYSAISLGFSVPPGAVGLLVFIATVLLGSSSEIVTSTGETVGDMADEMTSWVPERPEGPDDPRTTTDMREEYDLPDEPHWPMDER